MFNEFTYFIYEGKVGLFVNYDCKEKLSKPQQPASNISND